MEDPVVPLERNLYGHPLAGLLWERQIEKVLLKHGWEKIPNWECLFVHREKGLFLSVYVDDIKLAGKKHSIDSMWKVLEERVENVNQESFVECWEESTRRMKKSERRYERRCYRTHGRADIEGSICSAFQGRHRRRCGMGPHQKESGCLERQRCGIRPEDLTPNSKNLVQVWDHTHDFWPAKMAGRKKWYGQRVHVHNEAGCSKMQKGEGEDDLWLRLERMVGGLCVKVVD